MSEHYDDDPSKYRDDNTLITQAMFRAQEAEQRANEAKVEALRVAAIEEAKQQEIARAVELSVANNPQLQAQRIGVFTSGARAVRSQDVGMIAPPQVIMETNVSYNGIEISAQQAKDMVEYGQWDRASYEKAVTDALAKRGYKAPLSFKRP